jgi:proteasome lid subunit RPN8/RPN11
VIDPSLEPIEIPPAVLHEMYEHARLAHPEECCGLLVGDDAVAFREVQRCANDMTRLHQSDPAAYPRDGSRAFHMRESDTLRVLLEAERRGLRVTGVYHSHVDAQAYFSELDQEFALQPLFPFPDAHHVVLAVLDGKVAELGAFRWIAAEGRFEGRRVEAAAP